MSVSLIKTSTRPTTPSAWDQTQRYVTAASDLMAGDIISIGGILADVRQVRTYGRRLVAMVAMREGALCTEVMLLTDDRVQVYPHSI